MREDLDKHVQLETWCLPHEAAELTNPYSDIAYNMIYPTHLGMAAATGILRYVKYQRERRAYDWDRGAIVVGLA